MLTRSAPPATPIASSPTTAQATDDCWLPLTCAGVERIAAIEDTALRNLWITQSYADLARRQLDVLDTDQTWCSFATWASNTAGLSIREAELPHVVDSIVRSAEPQLDAIADGISQHDPAVRRLGPVRLGLVRTVQRSALGHLVRRALTDVSNLIADGNTLVYRELAPVFVRFTEWLEAGGAHDLDADVDAILNELLGPETGDHPLVDQAFRSYVRAATTDIDDERAQHVLAGNIAVELHEQQRLQVRIRSALDAGIADFEAELDSICHRFVPNRLHDRIVGRARRRSIPEVMALWEHVATHTLMTLSIPGQTFHLCIDVPPLANGQIYPAALHEISNADLMALLDEWDPTGGTGRGSAAGDWADIYDRMGYIVNLFRSRQRQPQLTRPPFSRLELAKMRNGAVPETV